MTTEQQECERIESYLLGRMSADEAAAFEKEMAADDALRKRCSDMSLLAHAVKRANQEADLRSSLEKIERRQTARSRRRIYSWGFLAAACLSLAVILPVNSHLADKGYDYAPAVLELQEVRGGRSELMDKAVNSYNSSDYDAALEYIEEAGRAVEAELSRLGGDDSDVVARRSLSDEQYELDWYRALTLMKDRKLFKAKRALRAIAASDSRYAAEASRVLKEVY